MNWVKIALVLLSLLLYAFFLERLGFVLTTFVLTEFFTGLDRGNKLAPIPRRRERGGAGELCDF